MIGCLPRPDDAGLAEFNRVCDCVSLDQPELIERIARDLPVHFDRSRLPSLVASTPVFLAESDLAHMQRQVGAIERISRLSGYRQAVASRTHAGSLAPQATQGLLMGYDFHIGAAGPRLIEVNTNAGGAFVVQALLDAVGRGISWRRYDLQSAAETLEKILHSFEAEWRAARGSDPLRRIVIVEDDPAEAFLRLDMQLAVRHLERRGYQVSINDPSELTLGDAGLFCAGEQVDLVYNRLTDFSLTQPGHENLRQAYNRDLALISPAPHHHALLADKRNLVTLSDPNLLAIWGAQPSDIAALASVPETKEVTEANADELWARRRQLFFKPTCGFGSRAAYRGAKLTKRVWQEVVNGSYVAQTLTPPSERMSGDELKPLKYDVRLYTYNAQPLLVTARLYRGQTTNFRTERGGFAPVIVVREND